MPQKRSLAISFSVSDSGSCNKIILDDTQESVTFCPTRVSLRGEERDFAPKSSDSQDGKCKNKTVSCFWRSIWVTAQSLGCAGWEAVSAVFTASWMGRVCLPAFLLRKSCGHSSQKKERERNLIKTLDCLFAHHNSFIATETWSGEVYVA